MTNAIIHHVNSPSQNHQSITTNTNNPLLIPRAKLGKLLNSSSPNDTTLLSPLLIPNKHYPTTTTSTLHTPNTTTTTTTTTTTSSSSSTSSGNSSPRLSSYDDNNNNNNNNNQQMMSPYNNLQTTPTLLSPWTSTHDHSHNKHLPYLNPTYKTKQDSSSNHCCYLIGSLVREEGHVHSLAVKSGVLYTGSESNNIRVWNRFNDIGCLKSGSGFVKAITVISSKVFTAHHDGKIRIWTLDGNKRVGTFPKVTDLIKNSIKQVKLVSNMKHHDAVSCLGVNKDLGLLYSASWDKTIKVWRIKDGKCMESIDDAHADAINAIVVGFGGGRHHHVLFSGGADGKLKMWEPKYENNNNNNNNNRCDRTKHVHVRTLMEQKDAVTSLVVSHDDVRGGSGGVLYSGSSDGLVNFWEKEKERVVYGGALRGHKLAVLCLGAAGCMVFSGSADKSVCVWRRHIDGVHSCLAVLYGHSGPVKCLAVERDRDRDRDDRDGDGGDDDDRCRKWIVYSGSLDKSVRIWRVSEDTFKSSVILHPPSRN